MSCMYSQRYKYNKCSGWVHAKCSVLSNAAQYRRKVLGPAIPARPHRPSNRHHHHPVLPTERISDDSTFNVLQLNANGIGNKRTELGVVLERNKVKVAVIQETKISTKSKKPASRTTPQCVSTVPLVMEEDC